MLKIIDKKSKDELEYVIITNELDEQYSPLIFEKEIVSDENTINHNYLLYHLKGNRVAENDIFPVHDIDTQKRIGWIFPIQALKSKEHNYAKNKHFLRYAFVACCKLLTEKEEDTDVFKYKNLNEINEEEIILVLYDENGFSTDNHSIFSYIVDLYSYGYSFSGTENKNSHELEPMNNRLNIRKTSSVLFDEPFIIELYKNILPTTKLPVAKFHMLYQVIEILIAKIFPSVLTRTVERNKESLNGFDFREKLSSVSKEEYRINALISDGYTNIDPENKSQCNSDCIRLLEKSNPSVIDENKLSVNLYAVRNLIFHDYKKVVQEESLIEEINESFEMVLHEILLSFSLEYLSQ